MTMSTDPHLDWWREATALWAMLNDEASAEVRASRDKPTLERIYDLEELIAGTPARTPAGIAVQIRMALRWSEDDYSLGSTQEEALRNAIAGLERLAREG